MPTAASGPRAHPVTVQRVAGDHFSFGEPVSLDLGKEADVVLMRQDPPFDLGYITATHLLERIAHETLVVNDPANVRNAPEKGVRARLCALHAADAGHALARRGARLPRHAWRNRGQAAARQWRQGDLQGRQRRGEPVGADRGVQHRLSRAAHDPGVPPRRGEGRQAHRAGRRRRGGRDQPRAGRGRDPLQPRGRRLGGEDRC